MSENANTPVTVRRDDAHEGPAGDVRPAPTKPLSPEFRIRESLARPGWWIVTSRTGSNAVGEVIASVFGKHRAEIVRDALTQDAVGVDCTETTT